MTTEPHINPWKISSGVHLRIPSLYLGELDEDGTLSKSEEKIAGEGLKGLSTGPENPLTLSNFLAQDALRIPLIYYQTPKLITDKVEHPKLLKTTLCQHIITFLPPSIFSR